MKILLIIPILASSILFRTSKAEACKDINPKCAEYAKFCKTPFWYFSQELCPFTCGKCGAKAEARRAAEAVELCPRLQSTNSVDIGKVSSTVMKLGFQLYDIAKEVSDDGNVFLSPVSIATALAMLYAGSDGTTKAEIDDVAFSNFKNLEVGHAVEGFRSLMGSFQKGKANVDLSLANGLYFDEDVKESYRSAMIKCFDSSVKQVDFADSENVRREINQWVSNKTGQKITELLPEGSIDSLTVAVLLNAIYFKAKWLKPFDKANTRKGRFFTGATDAGVEVDMMRMEKRLYNFFRESNFRGLEIPYEGEQVSMLIILPNQRDGLAAVEAELNVTKLQSLLQTPRRSEVELIMPKFKMEKQLDLKQALSRMGFRLIFDPDRANFSRLSDEQVYVSGARHKALIEVDEEGTVAAGATSFEISGRSLGLQFVANRPFLYMILHKPTNAVLFMGRYATPPAAQNPPARV